MNKLIEDIDAIVNQDSLSGELVEGKAVPIDKDALSGALKAAASVAIKSHSFSKDANAGMLKGAVEGMAGVIGSMLSYLSAGAKGTPFTGTFAKDEKAIVGHLRDFASKIPYTVGEETEGQDSSSSWQGKLIRDAKKSGYKFVVVVNNDAARDIFVRTRELATKLARLIDGAEVVPIAGYSGGIKGEDMEDLGVTEWSGRRSAPRDPYWIVAKYPGKDASGNPFKKGDKVFYYPNTKTFLSGKEAEKASREFEAAKEDEYNMTRGMG